MKILAQLVFLPRSNNKEITVWRIRHAPPPPLPIQRSAKKGPGLHGVKECLFDVLAL